MSFRAIATVLIASAPVALPAAQPPAPAVEQAPAGSRMAYDPAFFAPERPDTAYDMILLLPAFTFDPGQSARGLEASAGNVLIDGQRPSTKFDSVADILKRIPASSVAHIELIRGGAPGIDMQGRTIVANVVRLHAVTVITSQSDALLTKDGRLGVTTRLDAVSRNGTSSLEGSLNLFDHQGTSEDTARKVRRDSAGNLVSSTLAQRVNPVTGLKASVQLEKPQFGGLLRIKGSFTTGLNRDVEHDLVADASGMRDDLIHSDFRSTQGELSADFRRHFGPRLELGLVALQNFERSSNVDHAVQAGTVIDTADKGLAGESILRGELNWQSTNAWSARFGIEGAYNFLDGTSRLSVDGLRQPLPSADVRVAEKRVQLSAVGTWKPSGKLLVEAGSRLELSRLTVSGDSHNAVSFVFPKPRLAVSWSPRAADQLRLRIERTVGQLDFGQFVSSSNVELGLVNAGNPELQPERDWIFEAAWERRVLRDGAIVFTLSHSLLQRVIDEVPVAGFSAPGNIGSGTRDQAELNLNLPLDWLGLHRGRIKLDGTWQRSRVIDPTTGERRRITNELPFYGTLSVIQDVPSLRSAWHIDVTSDFHFSIFRIDEIQRFRVSNQVDATWEFKARRDLSLLVQVQNLTNRRGERERLIFDGLRRGGALAFTDLRVLKAGPRLYVMIRKTM